MGNTISHQHESSQFSGSAVLNIVRLMFDRAPLSEVLATIARLIEGQGNGMLCAIWLMDDARNFHCAAAPSLPPAYVALLDGGAPGPNDGSCGAAVDRKEPVYVTDILTDPLWDNYRELTMSHGLRACWSRPLLSNGGKVLGTFASYYREPRTPSPADLQLIENASHIVGLAVERHLSEGELRRSEARKAAILDSALDCIVTMDHQGRITEFNPAAERTFGYRRDDVMGKQLADVIIPPSLRAEHQRGLTRFLVTGEARVLGRRVEMTAIRADESEFPVELAVTRIPLDGPPSFTGYLRDITERKRAEEELRRSEAFLAEGQHLSRTGSFSWRVATDEITWSEQLYRIFNFDPGVPVTLQLISSRVHPEDITLFTDMNARARGGGNFEYEHRLLMPDRSVKYLHVIAHATRDTYGRLEYIGAIQDVTERRLSEEALGEARSDLARVARVTSLGALTASIAHEVNQPLTGIITNSGTCLRMLAADPPNIEGAVETARRAIRDGHRASDVITRLRGLFAKKDPATEPVDLNEAAREVIALTSSELQRRRILLRAELAGDLPPINGDRVQLQQVILNLLLNAADAMSGVEDRPRRLVIGTERDENDCVRLTVQDAGVGFGPEVVERLFHAFYTTKSDGMGIGLSVSRSIIERHRGHLSAAPNDDGPGATFWFSIPRSEPITDDRLVSAQV